MHSMSVYAVCERTVCLHTQKLMLDLARDDLIPGRLEAFMDSAVQYTKNNMFKQLALMVIARY